METIPNWFWVIYYLFFVSTLGLAIISVLKKKYRRISFLVILLAVTVPIVSLINSIGRAESMNEFAHFISQLQHGAIWSIYTVVGYSLLVLWWVLVFLKSGTKKQVFSKR
ncbi:hypothetical protein [Metabacillus malikii]|uniref:Uncharacterized protein n=1 Tax=Metabacillus malikii TaxID=1504265 RepID=A0ABT9ZLJ2_9BACI|nr:hypothetical protein [Metabacillus malikii]MDQ0232656.1 hypothetical protein [Metabacillus malikii]